MDTLARLLVISILGCVESEGAVRARAGAGAGDVRREYEPLVFAAVPLHAPVPVLHVLSPAPLRAPRPPRRPPSDLDPEETAPGSRYKPPVVAGGKQRLQAYRDTDYEESYEYTRLAPPASRYEDGYESYASQPAYSTSHLYSTPSLARPAPAAYDAVYAGSAETSSALLYARPLPSGGYAYRRPAPKAPLPPAVKPTKEPPYIIKIHKYRIVKDRRRR